LCDSVWNNKKSFDTVDARCKREDMWVKFMTISRKGTFYPRTGHESPQGE